MLKYKALSWLVYLGKEGGERKKRKRRSRVHTQFGLLQKRRKKKKSSTKNVKNTFLETHRNMRRKGATFLKAKEFSHKKHRPEESENPIIPTA